MPVVQGPTSWTGVPFTPSGEPPDNGGVEPRVAKLEAAMEYVQRDIGEIKTALREIKNDAKVDFRLLFGALIVSTLGLAGLMAKGFQWF